MGKAWRDTWTIWYGRNGIQYVYGETWKGGSYKIMYADKKGKRHVYRYFRHCNGTDYLVIKAMVERMNERGDTQYWIE